MFLCSFLKISSVRQKVRFALFTVASLANETLLFHSVCVHAYHFSHVQLWWPGGLWPARLLCPWDPSGKNTGVGCMPSSRGSSRLRDQTHISYVSCVGRCVFFFFFSKSLAPCLENPRDRGAWWAAIYAVTQSRTWLKRLSSSSSSSSATWKALYSVYLI